MKIIGTSNCTPELLSQLKSHIYDILGCCQEVHKELGPWLNEYVYQEALSISFGEKRIPFEKEYYFQVSYHGHLLDHKHYMDFLCKGNVVVECKAISSLGAEQRQQDVHHVRPAPMPADGTGVPDQRQADGGNAENDLFGGSDRSAVLVREQLHQ